MHPEFAWRYLVLVTLLGGCFAGLIVALLERIPDGTWARWARRLVSR